MALFFFMLSMKNFVLISDILNLSLAKEDHEETVQKRWDYIQEQLEKDPNWVGYDYVEYWNSKVEILLTFNYLIIGTNGSLFYSKNNKWYKFVSNCKAGYLNKYIRLSKSKSTTISINRIVASTFIPKYAHLSTVEYCKLQANHKNGNKKDNDVYNLEWMTPQENTQHAIDNSLRPIGLDYPTTLSYLGTVLIEGPYKGTQFILAGQTAFRESGFRQSNVAKYIKGNLKSCYGCSWEIISNEKSKGFQKGVSTELLEYITKNSSFIDSKVKPILLTVKEGPYKNIKFCLLGEREIKEHGFCPTTIHRSCQRGRNKYFYCQYITQEEAANYPRGLDIATLNKIIASYFPQVNVVERVIEVPVQGNV